MTRFAMPLTLCGFIALLSCCGGEPPPPSSKTSNAGAVDKAPVAAATPARKPFGKPGNRSLKQTIPNAKQAFSEIMQLIEQRYVDAGISADELWSGAIEGMLGRLIQGKDLAINTTISPQWLAEMKIGLKGKFSGVGVVIKIVEDVVIIKDVIEGGPGDRAGIEAGDRILAIDGKRTRGLDLMAIVGLIRGKSGTTTKLFLQREDRERTVPVVRGQIELAAASGLLLDDQVAYVRITKFNDKTVEQLDSTLAELINKGSGSVLLDLRGCPGGKLQVSIAVADRFLSPGLRIVSLKRRDGSEEVYQSEADHPADKLPVVVLIDGATSSGAEIVAAAVAENDRGSLVGTQSIGKGSVEEIFKLHNSWAVKLSVARFFSPKGRNLHGNGLIPDFQIPGPERSFVGFKPSRKRILADPQVQAARRLLTLTQQ